MFPKCKKTSSKVRFYVTHLFEVISVCSYVLGTPYSHFMVVTLAGVHLYTTHHIDDHMTTTQITLVECPPKTSNSPAQIQP